MATLTLDRTWINLLSSGAAVSGFTGRGRTEAYASPSGAVRTYAGGRQRSVTSAGEVGTYSFELALVPRATVETLRAWVGQAVQVRDTKGRRFFGVFYALAVGEWLDTATAWNVTVSLSVVTATEAV